MSNRKKCIRCGKPGSWFCLSGCIGGCDCVNQFSEEVEELMKFPDVTIKPYAWIYSKGDYEIHVIRTSDGKLTIRTKDDDDVFEFKKSKPETVKAIAELLLLASQVKGA